MSISHVPWGEAAGGAPVDLYTLINRHGVEARITNYGGIVVNLRVPDRDGHLADVVLGFDRLEPYLARHPYFGALVGRVANRLGGATFTLDGVEYHVTKTHGEDHLHGGINGFDRQVWAAHASETADGARLELAYHSPDGEEGYPGNLAAAVTYTLGDDNRLGVLFEATTDRPTIVNLCNHCYWNLAADPARPILDHVLRINAARYLPVDPGLIPTGERAPVAGTPMDFTAPARIGARIDGVFDALKAGNGYDHCWVLDGADGTLREAAELSDPSSGRVLRVFTDQPGLQFYSGNFLDGRLAGKGGVPLGFRTGLCLETQRFPDTPNQPAFGSAILRPGELYTHRVEYRFATNPG